MVFYRYVKLAINAEILQFLSMTARIKFVKQVIYSLDDDDDPVLAAALEDDTNLEDEQMAKLMGFSSFDTTKVW